MDIVIRGKNVEVSESLRTAALKQMGKLDRFANGYGRAEIDFSEERNPRIADNHVCEVLVHLKGHLLKSHAAAAEPFAAVSLAVDKIEHQVKRLKEKRVTRTHRRPARVASAADIADEEEEEKEPARIVKIKQFAIKPMTPEEAALADGAPRTRFLLLHQCRDRPGGGRSTGATTVTSASSRLRAEGEGEAEGL